jgi:hypothetical protein
MSDARLVNALKWTYDRLSLDDGMNVKQQHETFTQIGNVLEGLPSVAADYVPNEWDDSAKLQVAAGVTPLTTHERDIIRFARDDLERTASEQLGYTRALLAIIDRLQLQEPKP